MTMPVIRVSDDTFQRLQQWAVPLKDTPDDAINRVLDLAEAARNSDPVTTAEPVEPKRPTSRRGRVRKLPQSAYRQPILDILDEMGGSGPMPEVLDRVKAKVEHLLGPTDMEDLPSGTDIRWRNTAAWERYQMIKDGLLKDDSPRGVWELTTKGIEAVERSTDERDQSVD